MLPNLARSAAAKDLKLLVGVGNPRVGNHGPLRKAASRWLQLPHHPALQQPGLMIALTGCGVIGCSSRSNRACSRSPGLKLVIGLVIRWIWSWRCGPCSTPRCASVSCLMPGQREGPQVVSRRGIGTAVLVLIEEWRRVQVRSRPSLKALLLTAEPRIEALAPERGRARRRAVVQLGGKGVSS